MNYVKSIEVNNKCWFKRTVAGKIITILLGIIGIMPMGIWLIGKKILKKYNGR